MNRISRALNAAVALALAVTGTRTLLWSDGEALVAVNGVVYLGGFVGFGFLAWRGRVVSWLPLTMAWGLAMLALNRRGDGAIFVTPFLGAAIVLGLVSLDAPPSMKWRMAKWTSLALAPAVAFIVSLGGIFPIPLLTFAILLVLVALLCHGMQRAKTRGGADSIVRVGVVLLASWLGSAAGSFAIPGTIAGIAGFRLHQLPDQLFIECFAAPLVAIGTPIAVLGGRRPALVDILPLAGALVGALLGVTISRWRGENKRRREIIG